MDISYGYKVVFVFTAAYFGLTKANDYEVTLERSESILDGVVDFSKFRVVRKGNDYVLSGNLTINVDLDNRYELNITSAYSPLGNNQFIEQPFRVPSMSFCDFMNTTYRKYIEPNIVGKTNIPVIPAEGLCPFPKGTYYIKDVKPLEDIFPNHMQEGLWKIEAKLTADGDCVAGIRIFVRITKTYS